MFWILSVTESHEAGDHQSPVLSLHAHLYLRQCRIRVNTLDIKMARNVFVFICIIFFYIVIISSYLQAHFSLTSCSLCEMINCRDFEGLGPTFLRKHLWNEEAVEKAC